MNGKQIKVLLLEDNPQYAELIRIMLDKVEGTQFNMVCATRLSTGLKRLTEGGIDVTLLDLRLPDSHGVETFDRVYAQAPSLPIIVLTATENDELAIKTLQKGAQDYLVKGQVDSKLLVQTIRYAIERKRSEEALQTEKERYRILVEESPLGVSIIGKDGRYKYLNPKFIEIFGYTLDDIPTGREWFVKAFPDEEYRSQAITTWTNDLKKSKRGESRPRTFTVRCKDGPEKVIEFRPVTIETGDQFVIYEDITERMRAEQALKESEEKLQYIINNTGDIIFHMNLEGNYTFGNKAAEKITGYPVDELLRMNIRELIAPEYQEVIFKELQKRIAGEALKEPFDLEIVHKDGHRVAAALTTAGVHGPNGKLIGVQGVVRDITERKRAEKELRETEERFRQLSEATFEGIVIHNKGTILDANQTCAAMFGYELSEIIGKNALDFLAPESRELALKNIVSQNEGLYEAIGMRKDGSTFVTEIRGKPITYQGRMVRVAVIRDITERKRAEETLQRSEEEYRSLFQDSRDAIYITSQEGNIINASQSFLELFGYSRDQINDLKSQDTYVNPDDRTTFQREIEQNGSVRNFELKLRKKDGTEMDCLLTATLRRGDSASIMGYQGIIRDITERKRAEERILQQMEFLRKVDAMKSEFVSVASHELRTPLAAIKNAVQLILQGKTGEINESQGKFLLLADRNINRFTNILDDLLDLSKIESGKMEIKPEVLDIRNLIEFILSSLNHQADRKSIHLAVKVPKELPSVYGDREKVEQILTNLIGNAVKFTPEGGEVSVSAKPFDGQRNMVAVSVRDSGIGIPEDQLDNIFEKFYQVEGGLSRSVGGSGLGLAITKGLVESLHGKIWAESKLEKGSTFTFTLPTSKGQRRKLRFRFILDREFRRAQETDSPLTLLLIDVLDQRTEVRHAFIDQGEETVKKSLRREADIVVRLEKEKLLAAFCEADLKGAQSIRQRIEEELQKHPMKGGDTSPLVKVGTATYPEEALSKRDLFRKAKERMRG